MNKTRQWAMLTAVACLAVLAAGWFLVVKPQRSHATQLRTQTQSVQSSNTQLISQINQLEQQQKDLPAQQKLLSQIGMKIPDNPALPSLIRQLSAAADGAGVNLVSLAPGQPTLATAAATSAATTAGTTATAAASGGLLAQIPLSIQVQGSYFNIEQFFSAVESLDRAMLVGGFTLAPGGGSSGGSGSAASKAGSGTAASPNALTAQINATVFESPQATTTRPSTTTGH